MSDAGPTASPMASPMAWLADFPAVPADRVAQRPLACRDDARLMVVDRRAGRVTHGVFRDLEFLFAPGDVLALNDVRVFPARLLARKPTGGRVKVLLLRRAGEGARWTALLTPSLRPETPLALEEGLTARVSGVRPNGEYELVFSRPVTDDYLDRRGRMPLPPYIRRPDDLPPDLEALDKTHYQTVYARAGAEPPDDAEAAPGAVAAPTAGLHFTDDLLARIRGRGTEVARLRLKVGWGTFRPVKAADYRDHTMLPEEFEVPADAAEAVNRARRAGKRVWAVGTTVVRALETAADAGGAIRPAAGESGLYIYPGHAFRAVDVLVTNFHLPGHTPLLLAAAFAGTDLLRRAYEEALRERYRFFSYGDAMVIL